MLAVGARLDGATLTPRKGALQASEQAANPRLRQSLVPAEPGERERVGPASAFSHPVFWVAMGVLAAGIVTGVVLATR